MIRPERLAPGTVLDVLACDEQAPFLPAKAIRRSRRYKISPIGEIHQRFTTPTSRRISLDYIALLCIVRAIKLTKDLVAASTVPLVLAILAEGENYGYAIIQRVRELSEGEIEWTDGMLYPVLHWLDENDFVHARWREAESGRQRKYYSLKPAGKKFLASQKAQWLTVHETLRRAWRIQHA